MPRPPCSFCANSLPQCGFCTFFSLLPTTLGRLLCFLLSNQLFPAHRGPISGYQWYHHRWPGSRVPMIPPVARLLAHGRPVLPVAPPAPTQPIALGTPLNRLAACKLSLPTTVANPPSPGSPSPLCPVSTSRSTDISPCVPNVCCQICPTYGALHACSRLLYRSHLRIFESPKHLRISGRRIALLYCKGGHKAPASRRAGEQRRDV